jgi:hypothetical protein
MLARIREQMKQVTGAGAHNEEFHNIYSSPNIIRMIKSEV